MRKALRYESNEAYWDRRWTEAEGDSEHFVDTDIYPVKYAEWVMRSRPSLAVDLGCGLGRLVKHYHNQSFKIVGIERSEPATKRVGSRYAIACGDVSSLPFESDRFDGMLAFGLYHNLENGLSEALAESIRCLAPGGRFCISMRPDNLEMRLNDWVTGRRYRQRQGIQTKPTTFHKWLVGESEFRSLLTELGCVVERVERARNVSILWKVSWLRASSGSETERRAAGYRLNAAGRILDRVLTTLLPASFCNVIVFLGFKPLAEEQG
jgi:SAM-dependent methyltransferase